MKKLRVALIYNAYTDSQPDEKSDTGSVHYLRQMIRGIARGLAAPRPRGRRSSRSPATCPSSSASSTGSGPTSSSTSTTTSSTAPSTRCAWPPSSACSAIPMTGSPALALGLSRYKYMSLSLLKGAGLPIPPSTALDRAALATSTSTSGIFPLIVHAGPGARRHRAGPRLGRRRPRRPCKEKVREILTHLQAAGPRPALPARAASSTSASSAAASSRSCRWPRSTTRSCPRTIPPIMSYAAKWVETSVEYQADAGHLPGPGRRPTWPRSSARRRPRPSGSVGGWGYGRVDIRLDEDGAARHPRGQLQSLPRQRHGPGPLGRSGGHRPTRSSCRPSSRRPSKARRTTCTCRSSIPATSGLAPPAGRSTVSRSAGRCRRSRAPGR
ncbi:MAG: hypothetical protein M0C28_46400 [Candidatus Moduliflexus flocculans]|nr:hypothetical protein [Candidatus Moduliflexus flocculans]